MYARSCLFVGFSFVTALSSQGVLASEIGLGVANSDPIGFVRQDSIDSGDQEENNKPLLSWEERSDGFDVIFNGINFLDVTDFTWNGRIVTDAVNEMIGNLQAEIKRTQNGFVFSVKGESYPEEGDFGVMLSSGEVIEINMPFIPVSSERIKSPKDSEEDDLNGISMMSTPLSSPVAKPLAGASSCGGFQDASNPYPCCTNGSRPDGNCTWYAWYRAHQTYRGWGVKLPPWGNAKSWCDNAKKSGYTVSSNPRGADQGYSIGCNSSGTYGHVAWIWKYDNKYVWVDEQNCCDCNVAGTRIGAKYARSYFKYIYKK